VELGPKYSASVRQHGSTAWQCRARAMDEGGKELMRRRMAGMVCQLGNTACTSRRAGEAAGGAFALQANTCTWVQIRAPADSLLNSVLAHRRSTLVASYRALLHIACMSAGAGSGTPGAASPAAAAVLAAIAASARDAQSTCVKRAGTIMYAKKRVPQAHQFAKGLCQGRAELGHWLQGAPRSYRASPRRHTRVANDHALIGCSGGLGRGKFAGGQFCGQQ